MASLIRNVLVVIACVCGLPLLAVAQTAADAPFNAAIDTALPEPVGLSVAEFKDLTEEDQVNIIFQKLTVMRHNLSSPVFANGLTKPLDIARSHMALILAIDTKLLLTNPEDYPESYRKLAGLISQAEEARTLNEVFEETLRDLVAPYW